MAVEPTSDPLDRAVEVARAESPEGWVDQPEHIMTRVRRVVGPSEPALAFAQDGARTRDAEGSQTFVATRVIAASLRRLLQGAETHAPERIELDVQEERLVGVDLTLVCAYGVDLRELAGDLRTAVLAELRSLVGPDPEFGAAMIDIAIADVVDGDPNRI